MTIRPVKLVNWQSNLVAYLADLKREEAKASWDVFSCGHFFGGVMKAMTGLDPHEPFEGKYTTAEEAAALVREQGCTTYAEWVSKQVQGTEVGAILGQLGDIAMVQVPLEFAGPLPPEFAQMVGVVEPPYIWLLHIDGMRKTRMNNASRLFRVDRV